MSSITNFVTDNLSKEYFACRCGCGFDIMSPLVIKELQKFIDYVKRPVCILSGCRCIDHNKAVGGSENSRHLYGLAIDFYCPGLSTSVVWEVLEKKCELNGIIHYIQPSGFKFIHIDCGNRFQRGVRRLVDGKLRYVYLF